MLSCHAFNYSLLLTTEGTTKPCCYFKTGIDSGFSWSEHQKKLRLLDKIENCAHCIAIEEGDSKWSHRQTFNDKEFKVTVFLDNLCNLACVTCSPSNSSTIMVQYAKLSKLAVEEKNSILKNNSRIDEKVKFIVDLIIDKAKHIPIRLEILGGEPTISPNVAVLVESLIAAGVGKNITIQFITNGTMYLKDIKRYLTNFKEIYISISIDGIGDNLELIRYGTSFKDTEEVINNYKATALQHSNLVLGTSYTLSWMNSLHYINYFKWAQRVLPDWDMYITRLVEPRHYSIDCLKDAVRQKILKQMVVINQTALSQQQSNALRLFKEYLTCRVDEYEATSYYSGVEELAKLDLTRNTDSKVQFKELFALVQDDLN